jgi:hypothetical protein
LRRLLIRSALAAQLFLLPAQLALAQPMTGRTGAPANPGGGEAYPVRPRPTVESVSREAQQAIKACDDNAAFACVAAALANYAEALRQIGEGPQRHHRLAPSMRRGP